MIVRTTIQLTDEGQRQLNQLAAAEGYLARGVTGTLGVGNISGLLQAIGSGERGIYNPETQVVIDRAEYERMTAQTQEAGG